MLDPDHLAGLLPPPDRLALFLDVDGTLIGPRHQDRLVGIADDERATLATLRDLLADAVVVLTGRAIDKVDALFSPDVLPIAGLQGADRRFPDGRRVMPVQSAEDRRTLERIVEDVVALYPAVEIEWKPAGLALVFDEGSPFVGHMVALATDRADGRFKVMRGRVAVDVVPPDADKGRALAAFMGHPVFAGRIPVHFGDDIPDEPAFVASQQFGGFGVTVNRISSNALHRIADHCVTWQVLAAYADRHRIG